MDGTRIYKRMIEAPPLPKPKEEPPLYFNNAVEEDNHWVIDEDNPWILKFCEKQKYETLILWDRYGQELSHITLKCREEYELPVTPKYSEIT